MAIHVYAHAPNDSVREEREQEKQFLCDNLELLLEHAKDIVANREYFFCPLSFAWCSFLWIGGGGPLCLGHLLLGWQDGILTEPCYDCDGKILVTSFGGSPLSGSNSWSGICAGCHNKKSGRDSIHAPFRKRMDFALSVRKQFPQEVSYWEDYDGFIFSWGGSGLQPARKKQLVVKQVVEPVSLDVLVAELSTGHIRTGSPPQPSPIQTGYQLELRCKSGATITSPIQLIPEDEIR